MVKAFPTALFNETPENFTNSFFPSPHPLSADMSAPTNMSAIHTEDASEMHAARLSVVVLVAEPQPEDRNLQQAGESGQQTG